MNGPYKVILCAICWMRILPEEKTKEDEKGNPVHETCYQRKIAEDR